MKIDARSIGKVLGDPGAWRLVLLHGDDTGLIREHARSVVKGVAGSLDDPFRVALLSKEDQEKLEEEATALSLIGGRRAIWVREASDGLSATLKRVLDQPGDSVIVLEGAGLPPRSKLRALAEARPDSASIGCYPEEGRALESSVSSMLSAHGIRIQHDALVWLASRLGSDRAAIRGEVEKLALYAGDAGSLDLEDVQACIGDAGSVSIEDAAFLAMEGDRAGADLALERALAEGASPIAIARTLLSHMARLRRVRAAMEEGQSRADAVKALRPPVFFKRAPGFGRTVDLWPLMALAEAARRTQALELACKQTGAPDALLCRRHIAVLAAQAARRR